MFFSSSFTFVPCLYTTSKQPASVTANVWDMVSCSSTYHSLFAVTGNEAAERRRSFLTPGFELHRPPCWMSLYSILHLVFMTRDTFSTAVLGAHFRSFIILLYLLLFYPSFTGGPECAHFLELIAMLPCLEPMYATIHRALAC